MCGIAGIHRRGETKVRLVNRLADSLLLSIEHRGGDSTGMLAMLDSGKAQIQKTTERAPRFILDRKRISAGARSVLLHTRFATKGAVEERNAHPVIAGATAAIHNGMIYNDDALFAEYGMKRTAEVDSIVIPALLEHLGWDKAEKALSKLTGGAAVAIVSARFPDELILARTQGYPLHVLVTDDVIVWASERHAIERAWLYTYGQPVPAEAEWIVVAEWTMLRVNGKVETLALRPPKRTKPTTMKGKRSKWPARKTSRSWTNGNAAPRKTVTTPVMKSAPKPTAQLALPDEHEPWMDDAVTDLMNWADCDFEQAYEEVYGTSPPEGAMPKGDLDGMVWIDDVLVSRQVAEQMRRRADGWEVGL